MAHCVCCGGNVNIVARLTPAAGLQADWLELQTLVSRYAYERYQLMLERNEWDETPWDVCYRCYVFSGAERYYPFSMCPQYTY